MDLTVLEQQTSSVLHCLFDDRACFIETDGPSDGDGFDPIQIAAKLREIGDDFEESRIQPLVKALQQATSDQMATAFGSSVESLCQSLGNQQVGTVTAERDLLRASVALGLYIKRSYPQMLGSIQAAMATFINSQLRAIGGWENAV